MAGNLSLSLSLEVCGRAAVTISSLVLAAMADPIAEELVSHIPELCCECGQAHPLLDNHLYNFQDEVDDELICHICLQPLLQPMDTPCGHTYCFKCLENFMQEYNFCPMDRKKLSFQQCHKSSLLVRNLLDKLIVLCPFKAECQQTMQRCELEAHLQNRCIPPSILSLLLVQCQGCCAARQNHPFSEQLLNWGKVGHQRCQGEAAEVGG